MRLIDHRVDELLHQGRGRCEGHLTPSIYAGSGSWDYLPVEEDPGEPWTVT